MDHLYRRESGTKDLKRAFVVIKKDTFKLVTPE